VSKKVIANIVNRAANNWNNGQPFMSVNFTEKLPTDLNGMFTPAFNLLALSTYETVNTDLEQFALLLDDLKVIFGNLNGLLNQKFDSENIDKVDATPITNISKNIENASSTLTKETMARVCNNAGTNWLKPTTFLGLNIKEQLPNGFENSLNTSLNKLKNTTEDSVCDDLNSFADEINNYVELYKFLNGLTN